MTEKNLAWQLKVQFTPTLLPTSTAAFLRAGRPDELVLATQTGPR
jgi:hypothetical protein